MHSLTRTGIIALITILFSAFALAQYSLPVRDVENPARSPFMGETTGTIAVNSPYRFFDVGTIPAGQRLVIEHVAVHCNTDADDSIPLVLIYVARGSPSSSKNWGVAVLAQKQGVTWNGRASWAVSQPVRLYSDGVNTATFVYVEHSKLSASPFCSVTVSGHTIAKP